MTLLYKLCTFLQNLYMARLQKKNRGQKNRLWGGMVGGYRWGITQKYFLKFHKTKNRRLKHGN